MSNLEFVDTHVHFFDFKRPELTWAWLEADFVHPVIGNIDGIKAQQFIADEFIAESRFSNVSQCVHVQAALGTDDPLKETAWLQDMADRIGWPQAIVAEAKLQKPDVEAVLEKQSGFRNVRGIRDFAEGDYLVDPAFHRGYALLEKYDMVYDLDCVWEDMGKARALAEKYRNVLMILDHAGFPRERSDDYFRNWKQAIHDLAGADNVLVKISGLGMCDPRWTVQSLRPWVMECIEAFGVERSFFGTNWPVDRLFSSYPDIVDAYAEIISDLGRDEQVALFSGNAKKYYRL